MTLARRVLDVFRDVCVSPFAGRSGRKTRRIRPQHHRRNLRGFEPLEQRTLLSVTVLSEGFEQAFPAQNSWSVGDANTVGTPAFWNDVNSSFGGEGTHGGSWKGYCAGTGNAGTSSSPTYRDSMNAYMSKSINLAGLSNANLSFWYKIPSIESHNYDHLRAYIDSTNVFDVSAAATSWTQKTISLNSYLGGTHTLKFEFYSDVSGTAEGAYLDDILVTAEQQSNGPANNTFANRATITGTTAMATGTNVGATKESGEPNHFGISGGKSVWWTWTAPASGSVQIDTIGSNFDTIMSVYTGSSVSSLSTVIGDDDSGGSATSKVTFNAVGGTTYQIAVDGYNAASGNITLHANLTTAVAPQPPANVAATDGSYTDKVRITWTQSANASAYEVWRSATNNSGAATKISSPDVAGTTYNDTTAAPGSTYWYWVKAKNAAGTSGFGASNSGYRQVNGPANNSFANRATITGVTATATGTNIGATKESGEPNHFGISGGKSVWWSWTAPSNGSVQIDSIGSNFDTIMGVYTGSGFSTLNTVDGDDDDGGNCTSKVTFDAVAGTVYQIAVDGYNYGSGAASGNITLHVSLDGIYDGTTPAPGTTNTNAYQPVNAPVHNDSSARSVANYNNVINQFAVQLNPRYTRRDSNGDGVTDTFCNIFASDVTRAMNAEIPHWYDATTGSPTAVNVGREMNATRMLAWLHAFGAQYGWHQLQSAQAAQNSANAGRPTIVIGNGGQNSGHVAVVRPGQVTSLGASTAQAGSSNFNQGYVFQGFYGGSQANYVEYWDHA